MQSFLILTSLTSLALALPQATVWTSAAAITAPNTCLLSNVPAATFTVEVDASSTITATQYETSVCSCNGATATQAPAFSTGTGPDNTTWTCDLPSDFSYQLLDPYSK